MTSPLSQIEDTVMPDLPDEGTTCELNDSSLIFNLEDMTDIDWEKFVTVLEEIPSLDPFPSEIESVEHVPTTNPRETFVDTTPEIEEFIMRKVKTQFSAAPAHMCPQRVMILGKGTVGYIAVVQFISHDGLVAGYKLMYDSNAYLFNDNQITKSTVNVSKSLTQKYYRTSGKYISVPLLMVGINDISCMRDYLHDLVSEFTEHHSLSEQIWDQSYLHFKDLSQEHLELFIEFMKSKSDTSHVAELMRRGGLNGNIPHGGSQFENIFDTSFIESSERLSASNLDLGTDLSLSDLRAECDAPIHGIYTLEWERDDNENKGKEENHGFLVIYKVGDAIRVSCCSCKPQYYANKLGRFSKKTFGGAPIAEFLIVCLNFPHLKRGKIFKIIRKFKQRCFSNPGIIRALSVDGALPDLSAQEVWHLFEICVENRDVDIAYNYNCPTHGSD